MKKLIWVIIIVIILGGLWWWGGRSDESMTDEKREQFTIGAILPLTGPAAILGEPMKNGIALALKERDNIEVLYEDSKAEPAAGVSAYHRLRAVGVDAVVSAYSGVSVPLTTLAVENEIPLVMSIVAASNVTNDYSYRYYANPNSYVSPAFTDPSSPLQDLTKIAVLWRNDEYGKSVSDVVLEMAQQYDKEVVISESYQANETDFSAHLTKIKAVNPQAVLFIDGTPAEGVGILKKAWELKMPSVFIETSAIFSDPAVQQQAPVMTYYTTAFSFSLPNDSLEFKKLYTDTYGQSPNFAAAFGYDIANLIASCADMDLGVRDCLSRTETVTGITGEIDNIVNHEINPPMFLVKVN